MPVRDPDSGLVWNGYSPRMFNDRLPKEQYVSRPFYFGGSQVPVDLGVPKMSAQGGAIAAATQGMLKKPITRGIQKLPSIRKF